MGGSKVVALWQVGRFGIVSLTKLGYALFSNEERNLHYQFRL